MERSIFLPAIVLVLAFLINSSSANDVLPPGRSAPLDQTGDSPLGTCFAWEGHGDVLVLPVAFVGGDNPATTFTIDALPLDATVVYAAFSATAWPDDSVSASATFEGTALGEIAPTAADNCGSLTCCLYRWEVTNLVPGNGSYYASTSGVEHSYALYLVVVYEHTGLPYRRIVINDGAEGLELSYSRTYLNGFEAGDGLLRILIEAAQAGGGTDESVELNDEIIAGPGDIFVANIGNNCDYHEYDVTNILPDNALVIRTGEDYLGIHLAILSQVIDVPSDLTVQLIPFVSNIQIPAAGGSFEYYGFATNGSTASLSAEVWTVLQMPDSLEDDPFMGPVNCTFDPGTVGWYKEQVIDESYQPGEYLFIARVGIAPDDIWTADTISFVKLGGTAGPDKPFEEHMKCKGREEASLSAAGSTPDSHLLLAAAPNPFNPATVLRFGLPEAAQAKLQVYNLNGRLIATLVDGWRSAGYHEVTFDAGGLAAGLYFYHLTTGNLHLTGKMMYVK